MKDHSKFKIEAFRDHQCHDETGLGCTPNPKALVFENMKVEMPKNSEVFQEPELVYRSPVKVKYLEMEQANRAVGKTGESIALEYERWRLIHEGKESLADKIEWVSQTQGDGWDLISFPEIQMAPTDI